jgi:hypothetical protein
MTKQLRFLAQLDGLNPLNPTAPVTKGAGMVFQDLLLIITVGLALGLLLLIWARYYVRKRKRRHHRHEPATVSDPAPVLNDDEDARRLHGRRHQRRRHRRDHRPRNPTLAETGGLPQSKTEAGSDPPL